MTDSPLLSLHQVCTAYGAVIVLRDVSIDVRSGEVICLMGSNASGKSTVVRTILGLVRPTSGTIEFDGRRIDALSSSDIIRMGVAAVPEGRRLFLSMNVRDNLMMGAHVARKLGPKEVNRRLDNVLEFFPLLRGRLRQDTKTLSGGEQQLVAFGRALMAEPRMIIMDEPSMGLAPAFVEQVYEIIGRIAKTGTTMLIVDHRVNVALTVADRAYVLRNGRVAIADSAEGILNNPSTQEAYLGVA